MLRKIIIICISLTLLGACAPVKKETEVDRFMEKWQRLAEDTQGHSATKPSAPSGEKELDLKETVLELDAPRPERALPRVKVSLRMYDTEISTIISALGRGISQPIMISPSVKGTSTINVHNQRWDLVVKSLLANNGLSYQWEGNILRIVTIEDIQKTVAIENLKNKHRQEGIIKQRVEPLHTTVINIKYAQASDLKENLSNILTKEEDGKVRGSVDVNKSTNSVLVRAIRKDLKRIRKLVEVLDKPRKQIRMVAHIIEATKDTARELGTQWGGRYSDKNFSSLGGGSNTKPDLGPGLGGEGLVTDMTSFFSKAPTTSLGLIGGDIAGNFLELQLKALEQENKINILSSPSIITLDNQVAFTESGERVPYQSSSQNEGTNVEFQDAVLRLEITPHVIDHETLRLKILIKKDEVDPTRHVDGNPFIIKKHTETTLIARNNETVVITGLSKSRATKNREGIPYVQDIPGIGRVFAGQENAEKMEEYLIFIRPSILPKWKDGEVQVELTEIEAQMARERALKKAIKKAKEIKKKQERAAKRNNKREATCNITPRYN